jgi:hypothetical protein
MHLPIIFKRTAKMNHSYKFIFKMRYFFLGIVLIVFFEFCGSNHSSIKLKKVYAGICDMHSSLSLKKDSLFIIEKMYDDEVKMEDTFYYRVTYKSDDTFAHMKNFVVNKTLADKLRKSLSQSSVYIDTIAQYRFSYDKIPDTLQEIFNKNERVISFKEQLPYWIYLARDDKEGTWRLYVAERNGENAQYVQLVMNPETPDFFLFDLIGNKLPEIFIVRKAYFMNRFLREIDVYQLKRDHQRM